METLLIDIGGSGIKYATLRDDDFPNLQNEGKRSGVGKSLEEVVAAIAELYRPLRDQIDAIAICACMVLDTKTGYVYSGGSYSGVREVNLCDAVSAACDKKPVTIDSDGDCCLRAELHYGVLQGCQNAGVFVFGTGIANAFIIDGHILTGHGCAAGETSFCAAHNVLNPDFPSWASVSGMRSACERLRQRKGMPAGSIDGFVLFELLRKGDPEAEKTLDEMCEESAQQIYNSCLLLSPEKIAIGGGISGEPELLQLLREKLLARFAKIKDISACKCPELIAAKFRNQANLLGAYARLTESAVGTR